jgi:hypothetical protein
MIYSNVLKDIKEMQGKLGQNIKTFKGHKIARKGGRDRSYKIDYLRRLPADRIIDFVIDCKVSCRSHMRVLESWENSFLEMGVPYVVIQQKKGVLILLKERKA